MRALAVPALALVALLGAPACVTPVHPMRTPLSEQDLAPFAAAGSSSITGQAFLKTRGAEVRPGAGMTVELVPLTPYVRERLERETIGGEHLESRDPRLAKYIRTTLADPDGGFEFHEIPAGEYVALCAIHWQVETSAARYSSFTTGGQAYGVVRVAPGETARVVVTRP